MLTAWVGRRDQAASAGWVGWLTASYMRPFYSLAATGAPSGIPGYHVRMYAAHLPFLRTLCSLRWLATAGQAVAIVFASQVLQMDLPQLPLWAGVGALALFNALVQWHLHRRPGAPSAVTAFGHLLVDITILTWMLGWSGGIANPFGTLFLILIALAALALPRNWTIAVAAAAMAGYAASALAGLPLPAARLPQPLLQQWGMAINFLLSSIVVLVFASRLAAVLRQREVELARMRERFTRDEGILALATHAASVAHELNTPLATLTLLIDDLADQHHADDLGEDLQTAQQLLVQCRERVLALAAPASSIQKDIALRDVLAQWQLVRPSIHLHSDAQSALDHRVEPAISHLLMVLLNNAADASLNNHIARIDLTLTVEQQTLSGEVRDYGPGFDPDQAALPGILYNSGKSDGMGVGLALSHATIDRLGGRLWMRPADGLGTRIRFRLPLETSTEQ